MAEIVDNIVAGAVMITLVVCATAVIVTWIKEN